MGLLVVLDTNAVLDWLHFRNSGFAPVAQAIEAGRIQPVTATECLEELRAVVRRAHFSMDEAAQQRLLDTYGARCTLVELPAVAPGDLPHCRDGDDQKFLELASQAGVACLITKDKALLRLARAAQRQAGFAVLTPERFVQALLPPL